jgi:hypothetical protein
MSVESIARAKAKVAERDLYDRMDGHDALPPDWRELSRLIHGRAAEFKFKQGVKLAQAYRTIKGTYKI